MDVILIFASEDEIEQNYLRGIILTSN